MEAGFAELVGVPYQPVALNPSQWALVVRSLVGINSQIPAAWCMFVILTGTPFGSQCEDLRNGVHVLVCTPGRLLDHVRRQSADAQLEFPLFFNAVSASGTSSWFQLRSLVKHQFCPKIFCNHVIFSVVPSGPISMQDAGFG